MYETVLTVQGRVGGDPELKVTSGGQRLVRFRLAANERRYDRTTQDFRDQPTHWWTVTCWRSLGEHVLASLAKGDPVVVHGKLHASEFERNGVTETVVEIEAFVVGHDLSRGTTRFTRAAPRRPTGTAADEAQPAAAGPTPTAA